MDRDPRAARAAAATREAVAQGSLPPIVVTTRPVTPVAGPSPVRARTVALARTRRPSRSRIITGESMASNVRRHSDAAWASAASDWRSAPVRSSICCSRSRR